MNITLKTMVATAILSVCAIISYAQGGNHVFSGAEATNFGVIDLATPSGKTWGTFRGAIPGYFSAVGTASYTNPGDADNIDGYVKHYADGVDQAFTFPVGTGTDYRSLAISGSIPASSIIAVAWILGDPSTNNDPTSTGAPSGLHDRSFRGPDIKSVSDIGQWDWQDFSDDASGTNVTVSIPDLSAFVTSASELRLVGWNGTMWVNLSGASGASGITENSTLSGIMISGISALGIGSNKPLPNLSPVISFLPNNITNSTSIGVILDVYEFNSVSTSGLISVYIKKDPKYILNFAPSATTVSGRAVSNSSWTFDATSNSNFYILTTNSVIAADGLLSVGFTTTFNPNSTKGSTPIVATILLGSGGEIDDTDNVDNDILTYNFN